MSRYKCIECHRSTAAGLLVGSAPGRVSRCECHAAATAQPVIFSQPVRLWNSGVCPFAQRVWIALLELETPFTHEKIDLSSKPDEFLALSEKAGGTAKVPLLEIGEEVVCESMDIVRLLGKDTRLLPPQGDGHIDEFIDVWVGKVEPAYYDLLRAPSEQQAQARRYPLLMALSEVENRLLMRQGMDSEGMGSSTFLCDDFSLAECVAAPSAERMLAMLPHWRALDLPSFAQQSGLDRTRRWLLAVAEHPSVVESSAGEEEMARASRRYYVEHVSPGAPGVL